MSELFDEFSKLGREASVEPVINDDVPVGVTVRLYPETVCTLDVLAHLSGLSRQKITSTLIESSLDSAVEAFLEGCPDREGEFEHYLQISKEEKGLIL